MWMRATAAGRYLGAGALAAALFAAPPGWAQRAPDPGPRSEAAREYAACMRLARDDPKAAHEAALAWREKGGGNAAEHCIAVALLGLGQHVQAARLMEEIAARTDGARAALKAGLLAQAANAWAIAGRAPTAEKLLGDAIALRPEDVELRIDRSISRAAQGKYWEALDDLNAALERAPDRADALTFRASAWRHVGAAELARQDIDRALALRPNDPDALLERGLIRKATGDIAGARADWLQVLQIAVEGPLTEAARRNLESIDVRQKR